MFNHARQQRAFARYLRAILIEHGNITGAAKEIGISRATLLSWSVTDQRFFYWPRIMMWYNLVNWIASYRGSSPEAVWVDIWGALYANNLHGAMAPIKDPGRQ